MRLLLDELPEMHSQGAQLTGQMRALLLSMLAYSPYAIFDIQPGQKDEIDALIGATVRALTVNPEIGTFRTRISDVDLPDGWIVCNGQLENQSEYPDLMTIYPSLLKTPTQFYAPNLLNGRHMLHVDPANGFAYLSTGGNNWIQLTVANMPIHSHGYQQAVAVQTSGGEIPAIASAVSNVPASTTSAGSGSYFDIRNPYAVVPFFLIGR